MTLACGDAKFTVADVDAEKRVDTRFGQDVKVEV